MSNILLKIFAIIYRHHIMYNRKWVMGFGNQENCSFFQIQQFCFQSSGVNIKYIDIFNLEFNVKEKTR